MTPNIYSGSKFFRFIEGREDPEIIRIYSISSEKSKNRYATYFDETGKKSRMSLDYLLNNYRQLKFDGFAMFSIVSIGDCPDVLVALQSSSAQDLTTPYAICRQGISDVFSNYAESSNIDDPNRKHHIGVSISVDTCPANIDFKETMLVTGLSYRKPIAIYLDDTLEDILKCFSNTRFDNALISFRKKTEAENAKAEQPLNYSGFCNTLEQLMLSNNFMYDFRKCFGIRELPFSIKSSLEAECLSAPNVLFLENELKQNIMETYVIKYTKEINLKDIKRDYILATSAQDGFDAVYIIGYDVADGPYMARTSM